MASRKPQSLCSVSFTAALRRPAGEDGWWFVILPPDASARLPSRGMVTVDGVLDGRPFRATLEPDGKKSHWMKVPRALAGEAAAGDSVAVEMTPVAEEPEPEIPADFAGALAGADPEARRVWVDITPIARRDWIQWATSAKKPETRAKRIATGCSMLASGKRRPCCFDRSGICSKTFSAPVEG